MKPSKRKLRPPGLCTKYLMKIADLLSEKKVQTIASATGKHGEINRRKAKAAVDPHNYFKNEKSAYQNTK